MADSTNGDAWEEDPLKLKGRPSMPCDLGEVFRVGTGEGSTKNARMALPHPPFDTTYQGGGVTSIPSIPTVKVEAKRFEFEFYVEPKESDGRRGVVGQLSRALCTEALHVANGLVMAELQGRAHGSADKCGADGLFSIAAGLCASYPYPQFPTGVALLLPSSRMASLLSSPGTHVAVWGGSGMQRVFANGVEAIAYGPEGAGNALTYIVPRRGSVGLAMSKVAIHAPEEGGRRHVKAHFYAGAHPLSGPVRRAAF